MRGRENGEVGLGEKKEEEIREKRKKEGIKEFQREGVDI